MPNMKRSGREVHGQASSDRYCTEGVGRELLVDMSNACSHAATSEPLTQEHIAFPNQPGRQQHRDSLYTSISDELDTYQAPPYLAWLFLLGLSLPS
jgi:hypothetical protein